MDKKPELEPIGGFDQSIDIPTWLGVAFVIGALLLATTLGG